MPWLSALQAVGLVRRNINRKLGLATHIISVMHAPHSAFDGKFHLASLLFLIRPLTLNLTSDLLDSPYLLYRRSPSESESESDCRSGGAPGGGGGGGGGG